jgi:predicted metal-binding protein
VPETQKRLKKLQKQGDILVKKRDSLLEEWTTKNEERERMKANLSAIARARSQVILELNDTQREEVNQCDRLVQQMWKPQASRPTDIPEVDEFLEALREYRKLEKTHWKPYNITSEDVFRLSKDARRWLGEIDQEIMRASYSWE